MADKSLRVELRGGREVIAAFKRTDKELPRELGKEFKGIAEMIAGRVRGKVPRKRGKAAASVKARGSQRGAAIAAGGSAAPYYAFLDFGGSVGRGHTPGKAWSGAIKREWEGVPVGTGRYLYPTISDARPETADAADDAIRKVAKRAGFETHGRAG